MGHFIGQRPFDFDILVEQTNPNCLCDWKWPESGGQNEDRSGHF
jgi:hypothetical protein